MRIEPAEALLREIEHWTALSRRQQAELGRALRRLGWSYDEIVERLPVARSTVAGWCRDLQLSQDQIEALKRRSTSHRGVPRDTQRHRRAQIELLRVDARSSAARLVREPEWVAGVVLYWGEGSKAGRLQLSNSDATALQLFKCWCLRYHDTDAAFSAALNLHDDNDVADATARWASALGLSSEAFTKPFIKPAGTGHRTRTLPFGVCRLTMRRSTDALHRTLTWIDELPHHLAYAQGGYPALGSLAQFGRASGS